MDPHESSQPNLAPERRPLRDSYSVFLYRRECATTQLSRHV